MIAAATEPLLGILKYVLLALLYVFFARVLWAVWSEVRAPQGGINVQARAVAPTDPTVAAPAPVTSPPPGKRAVRASKGRRGNIGRFVVIEPKLTKGTVYAIGDETTIGRAATAIDRHG